MQVSHAPRSFAQDGIPRGIASHAAWHGDSARTRVCAPRYCGRHFASKRADFRCEIPWTFLSGNGRVERVGIGLSGNEQVCVDFCCAIPLTFVVLAARLDVYHPVRLWIYLRLVHLQRSNRSDGWGEMFPRGALAAIKFARVILIFIFFIHTTACMWHLLGAKNPAGWISAQEATMRTGAWAGRDPSCCVAACHAALQRVMLRCNMSCCIAACYAALQHVVLRCKMSCCRRVGRPRAPVDIPSVHLHDGPHDDRRSDPARDGRRVHLYPLRDGTGLT
jgi:hypothetical protein